VLIGDEVVVVGAAELQLELPLLFGPLSAYVVHTQ